jgi:TRAP-type mannitol/chloroaromatic compound transport system substrate-binding protein
MMAKYDLLNPPALRRLLAGGTKLRLSPRSWKPASNPPGAADEIATTNASFKKVYDSMNMFTNNGYQWFQVAELGYDSFMARHLRG